MFKIFFLKFEVNLKTLPNCPVHPVMTINTYPFNITAAAGINIG